MTVTGDGRDVGEHDERRQSRRKDIGARFGQPGNVLALGQRHPADTREQKSELREGDERVRLLQCSLILGAKDRTHGRDRAAGPDRDGT